jgi:2-oxo-4-hydroxy-4-carboxy-5-ureidoimidazoline decarboxylase
LSGTGQLAIDEVNDLDDRAFVAVFGHVYESTPSLASVAGNGRPFADREAMLAAFAAAAGALDEAGLLALLRAHPPLAVGGPMAKASMSEQRAAGLVDLEVEDRARIRALNADYQARFGFPFIIAVKGLNLADIESALRHRLGNPEPLERAEALAQVQRIAELRVVALVGP